MDTDRAREMWTTAPLERSQLMVEGLDIELEHEPDVSVVSLAGEIDLATHGALAHALCTRVRPGRRIVVDLDQVTLLDAAGVALAVRLQREARALGGDLVFVNPRGLVARVLEIVGVHDTLTRGLTE